MTPAFALFPRVWSLVSLLVSLAVAAVAAPPALRDQVSLNGTWPVGGEVPTYAGIAKFDQRTYERDVPVPAAWAGKVVRIEFGAVNFIAEVFVDGKKLHENIGAWCPFAVDVTGHVTPGQAFRLKVHVKGPKHPPIADERGHYAWPVGGWKDTGGIADDVWLRAYGEVHVEDAFIQTSVAKKALAVEYTVRNASTRPRTVRIEAQVTREKGGRRELTFASPRVALAPGEVKTVRVEQTWRRPALYWPDDPVLHHLASAVVEDGRSVDRETRRFGFREIELRGNQFYWNGVRANLYGDYQVFGDTWYLDSAKWHSPEAWPATVDKIKAMNLRVLRWHHNPVPKYLLDVADEKGLLICDEAANYGRDFHKHSNRPLYVENAVKMIAPWIRANRNHPSIYLWNATNEMTHTFTGPFEPKSLHVLGDEIRKYDRTRPIGYDGDTGRANAYQSKGPADLTLNRMLGTELIDYHYPEGYNKEPTGSIYSWARFVFPDKPTGAGEMLHTRSPKPEIQATMERNTWWLGVWLRGLRYTNWTNVKPACWWFTEADLASDDPARRMRTLNLRNALAPVALFDKAYDDLGIAPFVTGTTPGGVLPEVTAGAEERRTLVVYNDEFRDTAVTIEVALRVGGEVVADGRKRLDVARGEHVDVPCRFQVPHRPGEELALVLRTYKRGQLTFEETRAFRIAGERREGKPAAAARVVRFD